MMEEVSISEDVKIAHTGQVLWTSNSGLLLQGTCRKEYTPVKEMFEQFFKSGREKNAQLCVYVNNECVVDLYGTAMGDSSYGPNSLHVGNFFFASYLCTEYQDFNNFVVQLKVLSIILFLFKNLKLVFSSGKSVVALVIAMLVDRALLDYDEKVSKYWPEFAQNGKGDIKLSDVLRHESGLSSLNYVHKDQDILKENIKMNSIGRIIEKCDQLFPKTINGIDSKRAYHGITRGFILNEIVRRVDPKNR